MKDESKKATPEMIQQMQNIEAQAKSAKRWLAKKQVEESRKTEEVSHEKEMTSVEKEISNL